MERAVVRESASIAVIGALFLASSAVAGPVGGAVSAVAGDMLGEVAQRAWNSAYERFLGTQGIREPDLQAAMRRAYDDAMSNLERRWFQLPVRERTQRDGGTEQDAVRGLFQTLRADATWALTDEHLCATTADPRMLRLLSDGELTVREKVRRYFDACLYGHDEGLAQFVRDNVEIQVQESFAEQLKLDRPDTNRAWRAFQLLVAEDMRDKILTLQQGQGVLAAQLDQLRTMLMAIQAWAERLTTLVADKRESTGEAALTALIERASHAVIAEVENQAAETRFVVIEEAAETRRTVDAFREDVLHPWKESLSGPPLPTADVLLRGPIEALDLQSDLNRANSTGDRLAAASIYADLAGRLATQGHAIHARLMRDRHAQALVDGGSFEAACLLWLDDGKGAMENGALWIPGDAKHRLNELREKSGAVMAARIDALMGLEIWLEAPEQGADYLKRSLQTLIDAGDDWAPLVGLWLGEAVGVDGKLADLDLNTVLADLERLVPTDDQSTAIRLRLLISECSADWEILVDQATTGSLGPSDATLVLCRYGRWLALEAKPEPSIRAYRQAIEKASQARLLGDAYGAMRALAMILQQYTTRISEALDYLQLADRVVD